MPIESQGGNREHKPFKIDQIVNHPLFLQGVKDRAQQIGAGPAIAEALTRANVRINIEGDTYRWESPGQGALFVGDHINGIEDLLLFSVLTAKGREDIRFTAKPYSNLNHVLATLGQQEDRYMIPMMPRNMARGRRVERLTDKFYKRVFRNELLTEEQIRDLNRNALLVSAELLDQGSAVNIFPSGVVDPQGDASWQRGLGEIIKLVRTENRDKVMIIPYRIEGANAFKILLALLVKSLGRSPKEQVIALRLGRQGTIAELFQGDISVDRLSSTEISAIIEKTFKADLHGQ